MTKLIKGQDKSELSVRDQILLFEKMNRMLQTGIKKSLLDQGGARHEFQVAFGSRKPLKEVKYELASTGQGTGQILEKKILEDLKKSIDLSKKSWEVETCFAAGTLVHTKEGLVPIEQIKVGDWVLSLHESGDGPQEYKRVTRTFVHDEADVMLMWIRLSINHKSAGGESLMVTPNHPLWSGRGWKEAKTLKGGIQLRTCGEKVAVINTNVRTYVTSSPDVAWVPEGQGRDALIQPGTYFDVRSYGFVREERAEILKGLPREEGIRYIKGGRFGDELGLADDFIPKSQHLFRTRVYNIEVEDFHTYYVGNSGILVHNKNLTVTNTTTGSVGKVTVAKVFHTAAEMRAYLNKNQSSIKPDDVYLVRSGWESQEASRITDPKNWSRSYRFEENSPGRLTGSNGQRYEYALPYIDPTFPQGQQVRFLAVEGRLDDTVFVDHKLDLLI